MTHDKDYAVTLDDDKKYSVVDSLNYKDKIFLYLVEMSTNSNYIIGELTDDGLIEIKNKKVLKTLFTEFNKKKGD